MHVSPSSQEKVGLLTKVGLVEYGFFGYRYQNHSVIFKIEIDEVTYDHRSQRKDDPVRSRVLKLRTG